VDGEEGRFGINKRSPGERSDTRGPHWEKTRMSLALMRATMGFLRTDLVLAQAQSQAVACDKST
jgi:hypothetical protein